MRKTSSTRMKSFSSRVERFGNSIHAIFTIETFGTCFIASSGLDSQINSILEVRPMPIALLRPFESDLRAAFSLTDQKKFGKKLTSYSAALHVLKPTFSIALTDVLNDLLKRFDVRQDEYWQKSQRSAGESNWTWRQVTNIDPENNSAEVKLERRIVQTLGNTWANMIPVASGTYAPTGLGRVSIDLAERPEGGEAITFIELKIGSDNPFHAALEIAAYALMWIQGNFSITQICGVRARSVVL